MPSSAVEGPSNVDEIATLGFEDVRRRLFGVAFHVLGRAADAEDIVQEVFSQAWRQADRYDASRGSVLGWLLTLARSRAVDRVRSRRCRPESSGEALLAEIPDRAAPADEQLAWQGQAADIRAALEGLSTLQRVAIELAFYEGLTHVEIADRLELPLGTVKTRIRNALIQLRGLLK